MLLQPCQLRTSRKHQRALYQLAVIIMGGLKELSSKVLVLNAGSSSLKFKVFSANPFIAGAGGVIERIGDVANSSLIAKNVKPNGDVQKVNDKVPAADHTSALKTILDFLKNTVSPTIDKEVVAVGHRVVHGLDISEPILLTEKSVAKIEQAAVLAPLHNPPGIEGIKAAWKVFAGVPQVGVFDTAYHQTMPPHAFMYGLPYDLYEKHLIRRYGFHGTSHKYLVETAASMLNKSVDSLNVISCHLGNGSSITAVKNGQSVDTTMGMTPLEGLLMGTRSGDIDPAIPLFLMNQMKLTTKDCDSLLNKKSGLLGVCGNNDLRTVIELKEKGDFRGTLALNMFVYRIRKYIGAYMATLEGKVDAVIFSAGIGENSSYIRRLILDNLEGLGISCDDSKNKECVGGKEGNIASPGSKIAVLVIPTDEELSIAQQTLQVVKASSA